jgi:hypothetical protein
MPIEGESYGNHGEEDKEYIQLSEEEFRRVQKYANKQGITNEAAAAHLINKGGHILKRIIEKTKQKTKERRNIQNKRQPRKPK